MHGPNKAVGEGHLELASELLAIGVQKDTRTIHQASKSLDAVKWLVKVGYDVNTGCSEAVRYSRECHTLS